MDVRFEDMRVIELRELLWSQELVPKRWMLTYIKKKEAILLLERSQQVPASFAKILKERQSLHMSKALEAKKVRAEKYGITKLTYREQLGAFVQSGDNLKFVEVREFTETFESVTGSRRGKKAIVIIDDNGTEFFLTRGEAEIAKEFGLNVPTTAFVDKRSKPARRRFTSARDIFGQPE